MILAEFFKGFDINWVQIYLLLGNEIIAIYVSKFNFFKFLSEFFSFGLFFNFKMLFGEEMMWMESMRIRIVDLVILEVVFLHFHIFYSTFSCLAHLLLLVEILRSVNFLFVDLSFINKNLD